MAGPVLVIPYRANATETRGPERPERHPHQPGHARADARARSAWRCRPTSNPKVRKRSIYEAVVYDAAGHGQGALRLSAGPRAHRRRSRGDGPDARRAALRAQRPARARRKSAGSRRRRSRSGCSPAAEAAAGAASSPGSTRAASPAQPIAVDFAYEFRGNASLSLAPQAGDTRWTVRSSWPSPSFGGDFLPGARQVGDKGFDATYQIGNLALGRSLVSTGDAGASNVVERVPPPRPMTSGPCRRAATRSRPPRSA